MNKTKNVGRNLLVGNSYCILKNVFEMIFQNDRKLA